MTSEQIERALALWKESIDTIDEVGRLLASAYADQTQVERDRLAFEVERNGQIRGEKQAGREQAARAWEAEVAAAARAKEPAAPADPKGDEMEF